MGGVVTYIKGEYYYFLRTYKRTGSRAVFYGILQICSAVFMLFMTLFVLIEP